MLTGEPARSVPGCDGDEGLATGAGHRRAVRAWTTALVLLCLGVLWLEFRHIESTLPYPRHVDEGYVSGPAQRTIETGNLHPYRFNYPSLPKYLAAAGMAVGFLRGAGQLQIQEVQRLGNMGYPYYVTPIVMQTTRQLFALLSIVAAAATGLAAWIAFRRPAAILLAPLVLFASPLFFFHSWTYLNVDLVGASFVTLTIAACLAGTRRPSIHQSAVLPGVFAGFAAGSKYTLALVALPVLLAIGFHFRGARRNWAWAAALGTMAAAFIAVVPYSLIDIPGFLNGVAWETYHYASGHRGFSEEAGWPQLLFYLRHLASDFGIGGALLTLVGVAAFAAADWRRAAVLLAFPAGLFWLLASQQAHFTRNVLSLHPLVAMFAAFGLVSLHDWALRAATGRGWVRQPAGLRARVLAGLILFAATVPVWQFAGHLRDRTDSRNVAEAWIQTLPRDWTIVVPKQLGFDHRRLEAGGRTVTVVDLQSATDGAALDSLLSGLPAQAVIMVPRWGADPRYPGGEQADTLNGLARRWRVIKTFGTNPVLVNYSFATPWGDPAFAVANLK
jgi:hypothetical protein